MKRIVTLLIGCLILGATWANNVKIENVSYTAINGGTQYEITFDISWENAWNLDSYFSDAVWVFAKYKTPMNPVWRHLKISNDLIGSAGELGHRTTADKMGVIVALATSKVGNVAPTQLKITSDVLPTPSSIADIKLFAVEMVVVPDGPFWLGDGSDKSVYSVLNSPDFAPIYVDQNQSNLQVTLNASQNLSQFIDVFTDGFLAMKYECSRAQFVAFFNLLTLSQQDSISTKNLLTQNTEVFEVFENVSGIKARNPNFPDPPQEALEIYLDNGANGIYNEVADGSHLPMVGADVYGMLAYADWSGMRPMTEAQYEKSCRGPLYPVPGEYAWGNNQITPVSASDSVNPGFYSQKFKAIVGNNNESLARVGFMSGPNTNSRYTSSSSYYGICDLTGNAIELVVWSSAGLQVAVDGDGELNQFAESDWIQIIGYNLTASQKGGGINTSAGFLSTVSQYQSVDRASSLSPNRGNVGFRTVRSRNF
ncbi:MAG: SUMF1/EgtB/PvdO family nonheme iron enzyme [Luteibaculum sp.]